MKKSEIFPLAVVSGMLLVYSVLILLDLAPIVTGFIFIASPILVIWLVYSIIKHGEYKDKELKHGEEWGYNDRG